MCLHWRTHCKQSVVTKDALFFIIFTSSYRTFSPKLRLLLVSALLGNKKIISIQDLILDTSAASISLFQFRYDIDTILTK